MGVGVSVGVSVSVAGGRWRERGGVGGIGGGQRCHREIGLRAVMGLLLVALVMVGVHLGGMGCTACWEGSVLPRS